MHRATILALLLLTGCASAPTQTSNVCAVFEQKDGFFTSWYKDAKSVEAEYGVPVPILMATINTESGFQARVKPPRTKLLGFIPWKRPSTAYGYSQALDGTWADYQRDTGRLGAGRTNFSDAVHFVGWYHAQSHQKNGIALDDAYNLYVAYYAGQNDYARGTWRNKPAIDRTARKTAAMANTYAAQLRTCGL
ncbi:transglycosylase SLT domain-containing protein [Phyllobacterium lublinensis]|uniref:transglycosylase SLT domain-containing protein n=1 Tax=Phyllobacterium lublinensis TaxID=2875708 RepID=UPI001CCDFF9D|nr:hypothetical protein [Phyllobacterium sp. 2063]MBZ9654847.1 hypothetical protein [Phyllobacterium sp. 2063]